MMKKFLSLCLALAMTASLLAGCGGSDAAVDDSGDNTSTDNADTSSTVTSTEEPDGVVAGTSINMVFNSDIVTLQRPGQQASATQMYYLVYDTLFWSTTGDVADLDGLLVSDYTISDDGLVWVLDFHENVDFANGKHMDAEAIYSSLKYHDEIVNYAGFSSISDYSVTGEYQITITFSAPDPEFMLTFSDPKSGIFDAEMLWETGDNVDSCYMIGSGPYVITDYAAGDYITFTAVEDHWNSERQAHIETLYGKVITDTTTIATSIQSGEMDHAPVSDAFSYEMLSDLDIDYSFIEQAGNNLICMINDAGYGSEYLANDRVREALIMMIDIEELAYVSYGGYGIQVPNAFSSEVDYTHDRTHDPDTALAILAEEGIDPSAIVMTGLATAVSVDMFSNLQAQWALYGVTLDFTTLDMAAARSAGLAGEWDVWIEGGGLSDIFYSNGLKNTLLEGGNNQIVSDPDTLALLTELTNEATTQPTVESMLEVMAEMAEILDEHHSYIVTTTAVSWPCYSNDIQNFNFCEVACQWRTWESWLA